MDRLHEISSHSCFGGTIGYYSHFSAECGAHMRFGVFLPHRARIESCPALYCLAGLTCTEETFLTKSGATRLAAELGLLLIAPDTSPRGLNLAGEKDSWDFGEGASFYIDAEIVPWRPHYRMFSYITRELPAVVESQFPVKKNRRGILGHSMGGHGALIIALKRPDLFQSVSAFAPITNPVAVPWGHNAFRGYLGDKQENWMHWDASLLMRRRPYPDAILVDQGMNDQYIDSQLTPAALELAARVSGQALTLRRHKGYDHSYWFIQTFVADHLRWHAAKLCL